MDQLPRNDRYRTLRVLLDNLTDPSKCAVAVVARTGNRGALSDRLLLRRYLDVPLDCASVADVLRSASAVLFSAAAEMDRSAEGRRSPLEGATGVEHGDVRSRGITVVDTDPSGSPRRSTG